MASKSLGPFPKSTHWHEMLRHTELSPKAIDLLLDQLQLDYHLLAKDASTFKAIHLLVALPIATRCADSASAFARILGPKPSDLSATGVVQALEHLLPEPSRAKTAAVLTLRHLGCSDAQSPSLFNFEPGAQWRKFDGPGFCDLAREFFSNLNRIYFSEALESRGISVDGELLSRFAFEMAYITRSFSARWFNACAILDNPDEGSVRWYLGHCLGKLDLELSRERSDWIEPSGNPWRRKKGAAPEANLYGEAI